MKEIHNGRTKAPNSVKKAVQMILSGKFALLAVEDALTGILDFDFSKVIHAENAPNFKKLTICLSSFYET